MANRPTGYGMTAAIQRKMDAKYDEEKEQEARAWIEAVLEKELPLGEGGSRDQPLGSKNFHLALKDGVILCELASTVTGKTIKANSSKMAFKQMENISKFLTALEQYGVAKSDLFQTVDLYESQNMWQVVCCIHALGRKAQSMGYPGPTLGPKESAKNVREFSEDQLKAGQNVIGLQMGTNKVASQAGMSFGGQRHIADIKCDDLSKEGASVVSLQYGSNQGASQAGMTFGKSRGIMGTDK